MFATESGFVISTPTAMALPPAATISSQTCLAPSALRSATTTDGAGFAKAQRIGAADAVAAPAGAGDDGDLAIEAKLIDRESHA